MSDETVRLTTRTDIVAATYQLEGRSELERVIEHHDFVVALRASGVDVFRFEGAAVAERWTSDDPGVLGAT